MKALLGIAIAVCVNASSLMAWGYYPDNYQSYFDTINWRYPTTWQQGCSAAPAKPSFPEQSPQPKIGEHRAQPLEQQHSGLKKLDVHGSDDKRMTVQQVEARIKTFWKALTAPGAASHTPEA